MKARSILIAGLPAIFLVACNSEAPTSAAEVSAAVAVKPELCLDAGPQTPRDISSLSGKNTVLFEMAPPANEMNL